MLRSPLVLGTRGSALARWQANHVRSVLQRRGLTVSLETITTTGDRRLDIPLASIGEKALFTRELDDAILGGTIDLAVHSLKDLPSSLPEGIALAAVTERLLPFDAFVAAPGFEGGIRDLPPGAVIGTSSLRRQAQLLAWRADLAPFSIRGNVDTRLRKLDESDWHGVILAEAGLVRLGLSDRVTERIPVEIMLPAVGQGALGVVCAAEREDLENVLRSALHHEPSGYAAEAERAFLGRLEGGCSVPVGAYAEITGASVSLEGCVASVDGKTVVRQSEAGAVSEASSIGRRLAERLLASGADEVLEAHRATR